MKPVDFDYRRPGTLADAAAALDPHARRTDVKLIAGGQTLGPLLNLRLARPGLLLDIARLPELQRVVDEHDAVTLGACITHAAIEDGRVPDPANGLMQRVAAGIAYRAVRNRGTIGGSLAHADPAADWLAALAALDAEVLLKAHDGQRTVKLRTFVTGALQTDLKYEEIITGIRIPRLPSSPRWGFHKICRKTGEFADAIGVVIEDGSGGLVAVAGATGGAPIVMDSRAAVASIGLVRASRRRRLQGGRLRHAGSCGGAAASACAGADEMISTEGRFAGRATTLQPVRGMYPPNPFFLAKRGEDWRVSLQRGVGLAPLARNARWIRSAGP